jgi:hypothetical protein
MMIGAYDHFNAGFIERLSDVYEQLKRRKDLNIPTGADLTEEQAVDIIKDCDPVVCHVTEKPWEHLLSVKNSGLVLRVTTHGFRPIEETRAPREDKHGRYILHLSPPPKSVTTEEWQKILETLELDENRKALAEGRDPGGIRRFFVDGKTLVLLQALAVLCQGYLAVHAIQPKVKQSDIAEALDKMGWDPGKHTGLVRGQVDEKVEQPGWWLDVFDVPVLQDERANLKVDEERWKAFADSITREWEEDPGKLADTEFMKKLHKHQKLDSPKDVADVFVLIKNRLTREKSH